MLQTALHSLWQHITYYERLRTVRLHKLRAVAARHQALAGIPKFADQVTTEFDRAVKRSLSEARSRRLKRLLNAPKIPARVPVVILGFERNPDVVAEVLIRSAGTCEVCNRRAPFLRRKDGTPYLEVHHIGSWR